jgi:dihydrolipoamide dehydrogenase
MSRYDVAVVGTGPGGYVAAIRAAQRGAKVAVIEKNALGGVCLNVGCIPTKTLIYSAELYRKMQHAADYGLKVDGASFDMKAMVARKNKVVATNTGGMDTLVHATSIIIATGGRPAQLPGLEFNGKTVIGSTDALELTELPKRIGVIGAGAIGAEFACIWNALGAEVTLIEAMPHVLPREDEDLSKRLAAGLKRKGIDIRTSTKVQELKHTKGGVTLTLEGAKAGDVEVDLVLVGIGLECNSEVVTRTPGLGVQTGPRGGILVDERMETTVPGIYAIGDVTNKTWLAHGASAEGIVAATNATGGNRHMNYRVVPSCTFTSPEVASVGLTETQAKAEGYNVKTGTFLFAGNGRAHAMGETEGLVKIVGDAATDQLLGLHIMGAEAGELIAAGAMAMSLEATVEEIAHTIHTHPTLAEAIMEAAEDYYGEGIHTRPAKR